MIYPALLLAPVSGLWRGQDHEKVWIAPGEFALGAALEWRRAWRTLGIGRPRQ